MGKWKGIAWILLLFLACIAETCFAQDFNQDWKKAKQVLGKAENMSMETQVETWEKQTNHWLAGEKKNMILHKKGKLLHYKVGEMELLSGDKIDLMINHQSKQIFIKSKSKQAIDKLFPTFSMDSILKMYKEIKFLGTQQGLKNYKMTSTEAYIKEVTIGFDVKTAYLGYVEYLYQPAYAEIEAKSKTSIIRFDTKADISSALFELKQYIIKRGKNWVATQTYKNYQLINLDYED
jgi:hypothetical protein